MYQNLYFIFYIFGFTSYTAKIVLQLFKEYLGRGYALFMDNYYNSITLTRFLKRQKTGVVGTLNRRRTDCPVNIKNVNDKRTPRGSLLISSVNKVKQIVYK